MNAGVARCDWCGSPMPGVRAHAVTCSVRCRQARQRFKRAAGTLPPATTPPLRLAYADPPYPGCSRRYYQTHADYAGEVDHVDLIARLTTFDGWALSTSARALPTVLASCPPGARVAVWVRGERPTRSAWPLNAWEPVIFHGGRQTPDKDRRRVDVLTYRPGARTTDPGRVTGAKPAAFAAWVFELLGARNGDEFTDLYPGSGGVARAWRYASTEPTLGGL